MWHSRRGADAVDDWLQNRVPHKPTRLALRACTPWLQHHGCGMGTTQVLGHLLLNGPFSSGGAICKLKTEAA